MYVWKGVAPPTPRCSSYWKGSLRSPNLLAIYVFQNELFHKEIYFFLSIIHFVLTYGMFSALAFIREHLMFFQVWYRSLFSVRILVGDFFFFLFFLLSFFFSECVSCSPLWVHYLFPPISFWYLIYYAVLLWVVECVRVFVCMCVCLCVYSWYVKEFMGRFIYLFIHLFIYLFIVKMIQVCFFSWRNVV